MRVCLLALPRASWYAGHSFPPSCLDSRQLPAQGGERELGPLDLAYGLVHLRLESLMFTQVECGRQRVLRVFVVIARVTRLGQSGSRSSVWGFKRDACIEFKQQVSLRPGLIPSLLHPATFWASQNTSNRNMHSAGW